jgi:hypothetical protein
LAFLFASGVMPWCLDICCFRFIKLTMVARGAHANEEGDNQGVG